MRNTGSRESRDNREASATSPTSIAVNTFSIRFGSRRNHRPVHQKILSITTVSPIIDTIRIGHMIGPPLRKLSIKKLPVGAGPAGTAGLAAAAGEAAGERPPLNVAVTLAPGAGVIAPAPAGDIPSAPPGDIPGAPGGGMGAPGLGATAGFAGTAGLTGGAGFTGGGFWAAGAVAFGGGGGGAAGRFWANTVSAVKLMQIVSSVFITAILEL